MNKTCGNCFHMKLWQFSAMKGNCKINRRGIVMTGDKACAGWKRRGKNG